MHRDKPDEVLESLERLLGILEQSEVEACILRFWVPIVKKSLGYISSNSSSCPTY